MSTGLDPALFRALAATIVPESRVLDEPGWQDLNQVVEILLRDRSVSLQRQLRLFLRLIEWLPVARYGRPFTRLDSAGRARVLASLQNTRLKKIRVGFWGLRTIVLAGYYGRPDAARTIGYAATAGGWEARR